MQMPALSWILRPRNWVLVLLMLLIATHLAQATGNETHTEEEEESEPVDAILFPFFVLAMGVIAYLLLSRYAEWLPYTAVMFVIGTIMGVAISYRSKGNLLNESVDNFWLPIDSELLLVAFLPGLIYHDANSQNTHLFRVAFNQCLIFAFPMVLAGTALTALVAYYIFPYDWSLDLSLTFGSILAATDPVAVAALLDSVGAPPRLKVHIAGESLLNDGSAIVFFKIFSDRYLTELNVSGLGEDVDGKTGVKLFFRMSLGAVAIGIFFGLGLLTIMYILNRRLDREENVVQVGFTITMAYLCYFTADVAWETSGVLAVVAMAVMFKAFGEAYINDPKLMDDFWSTVEFLLNTVLFALGGLVWGSIIGDDDDEFPDREFTARDWGYLFLLYILLTVIRFFLFATFYPATSRIGLKSNWKEMVFQSFGGLRGAVGISLAIFLDNIVKENADSTDDKFVNQTNKLFGFVGGIAFLTLIINGVTAGPFLKYLGLADTSETRKRMLSCYKEHYRQNAIKVFVELLGQRRFSKVSFATVKFHVKPLEDLSRSEVIEAANMAFSIKKAQDADPDQEAVNLDGILPYLNKLDEDQDETTRNASSMSGRFSSMTVYKAKNDVTQTFRLSTRMSQVLRGPNKMTTREIRRVFIELVRGQYQKQISDGELSDREFVVVALLESLELAMEEVDQDKPLCDWDYVFLIEYPSVAIINILQQRMKKGKFIGACCASCRCTSKILDADTIKTRLDIEKALAFIRAHTQAQEILMGELKSDMQLEYTEEAVIAESEAMVKKAEKLLSKFDPLEVELVTSHKVCKIILNQAVKFVADLVENGLLKDQEALGFYEEIQESLNHVEYCNMRKHPGEKSNHNHNSSTNKAGDEEAPAGEEHGGDTENGDSSSKDKDVKSSSSQSMGIGKF